MAVKGDRGGDRAEGGWTTVVNSPPDITCCRSECCRLAMSSPQKVFDRHPTLIGAQIINYHVTPDEIWLVLIGIFGNTTNPSSIQGQRFYASVLSRPRCQSTYLG